MLKYDQMHDSISISDTGNTLDGFLQGYGDRGYELVSVVKHDGDFHCFFKRLRIPEAVVAQQTPRPQQYAPPSSLPIDDPNHVCGVMCDGQDNAHHTSKRAARKR